MTDTPTISIVHQLVADTRYLIKMKYSKTILEVKVLEVSKTAVKILYPNSGIKDWIYKTMLEKEYEIVEQLKD